MEQPLDVAHLYDIAKLFTGIETLTVTVPDFYLTRNFVNKVIPRLGTSLATGGAASEIKEVTGAPYVVKISTPCATDPATPPTDAVAAYCRQMKEGEESIVKIPHGDKELLMMPNFISEGVIGGYLGQLLGAAYTPHFVPIYGTWLSLIDEKAYTIMDRVIPNIGRRLQTTNDIYHLLFQVAQGLSVAQEVYRFTHYDLHGDNILYIESSEQYHVYHVPTVQGTPLTLYVRNPGFIAKITDYGSSRMETPRVVIQPQADVVPVQSLGSFNPYYDFKALIGWLFKPSRENDLSRQAQALLTLDQKLELLNFLFDLRGTDALSSEVTLNAFVAKTWVNWRGHRLTDLIKYVQTQTIFNIWRWLAEKLISLNLASVVVPQDFNASLSLITKPLSIYTLNIRPRIGIVPTDYRQIASIARGISVESFIINTLNDPPKPWNLTISPSQIANCPKTQQYIHILDIVPSMLGDNYRIIVDCCKLDTMDYIQNRIGVAINGSFFDIKGKRTMRPIGKFRMPRGDHYYESNLPIPALYKEYYGAIAINGGLLRLKETTDPSLQSDDAFAVTGPWLVKNGTRIADSALLQSVKYINTDGIKLFQSAAPSKKIPGAPKYKNNLKVIDYSGDGGGKVCEPRERVEKDWLPNAGMIEPGELAHASNPNPRTMLLTRKVGNEVVYTFVVIEGRDDRGMGVDLRQLAAVAQSLGAIDAINLDGGRSSAIAWRTENNPNNVFTINPNHRDSYPVGNIFAVVKSTPP